MSLRVVFMGSPDFAVPTLRALHQEFQVTGVITQADKPKGRGQKRIPTAVKRAAQELGLPVAEPHRLSTPETVELIEQWKPDVIVVAAYGKILPMSLLNLPQMGCVNLHASLLPRYRGASPISAAILAGESVTGLCTILMDEGMDSGAVLLQREVPIRDDDTAGSLHDRLLEPGAALVVETVRGLADHRIAAIPQDHEQATYTMPLAKDDGRIDWDREAGLLERLVRAMDPWPAAFFDLSGEKVKVWRAFAEQGQDEPGRIVHIGKDGALVGTGRGLLLLKEVQAPSRKRVKAAELFRARGIPMGHHLHMNHGTSPIREP
ncbi:MAG: methionyl-tRNA formyltransferase [Desulfomonile tiedjei]|nr:methionyl-tRNA formyltransferase [Desulfomonile tiedjei]